ncbi:MAG: Hsp20/alpha crystallin family protein [Gammaproteobacteria bacterium]|nr:Hsp20/alpha crystallin family protein [Gammaproteobacteria bacterium]
MNLVRYEPWNLFNQLHTEIDQLLGPQRRRPAAPTAAGARVAAGDWAPAVDIKEEADRFVIRADVPGVDPKDIDVQMENGILTIKGVRQADTQEERSGYKRVERVRGSFYRRFSLPDTTNADAISAKSQHGVLEIVIPKQPKVQPRRIQVEN